MKKVLFSLVLLLVMGAATFMLAEVVLRIAGFSYTEFQEIDPVLGFRNVPGAKGLFRDEGRGYVEFNSDGARGPEVSKRKPKGTYRIAVLGDSFTAAMQVSREDTFAALVEKKLGTCAELKGRKVEVINFGVSGFGTAQELLLLRQKVFPYSPDLVILAFFSGNDVKDNFRPLDSNKIPIPYITFASGSEKIDNSFRQTPYYTRRTTPSFRMTKAVIKRSRVLQLVKNARHVMMLKEGESSSGDGHIKDDSIYTVKPSKDYAQGWQVTENLIKLIHDESVSRGAEFLLVVLTNADQLRSLRAVGTDEQKRDAQCRIIGCPPRYDVLNAEKRLTVLARNEGMRILTLSPHFARYERLEKVKLHGFGDNIGGGHWNERGHRLASELIASYVCKRCVFDGKH